MKDKDDRANRKVLVMRRRLAQGTRLVAIGMALPGNGTILAVNPKREELYKQAGRQIMTLIEKDIKPLDIINEKSLDKKFEELCSI